MIARSRCTKLFSKASVVYAITIFKIGFGDSPLISDQAVDEATEFTNTPILSISDRFVVVIGLLVVFLVWIVARIFRQGRGELLLFAAPNRLGTPERDPV